MNISFTKSGNAYVATFEATGAFNLHIERSNVGYIRMEQRTTTSGAYAAVDGFGNLSWDKVLDVDCKEGIFPKSIRIISASKPTMAFVTFAE